MLTIKKDLEIIKVIEKLKKEGKVKFSSIRELSLETNISKFKIKKYQKTFKNGGIFIDIRTYEEKLLDAIKKLKLESKTEFESIKQLSREIGLGNQQVKKHLRLFTKNGIFVDTRTYREKLLDSINKLKLEGKIEFRSEKHLSKELGIYHGTVKNHLDFFSNEGILINKRSTEEKLTNSIRKLKKLKKDKFYSVSSLAKEIELSNQIVKKNLDFFRENGITIILRTTEEKLLEHIKELRNENKVSFKSINELSKYLRVNVSTIKKHLDCFEKQGISIDIRTRKEKILDLIEKLIMNKKVKFCSVYELSLETKLAHSTIEKYLDLFESKGIYVDIRSTEEKILYAIKKLKKEKDTEFISMASFERKTGISSVMTKNHLEFIFKNGIFIDIKTHEEKLLDIIERLKKEDKTEFPTIQSLVKETGVSKQRIREKIFFFREHGIYIDSKNSQKNNISNYVNITQKFSNFQLTFENHLALQELCEDFFGIEINVTKVCRDAVIVKRDLYKTFSMSDIRSIVEQAILNLSIIDITDFSLIELKYQLYLNKVYFSSATLLRILSILNESLEEDSITNRVRLSKRILKEENSNVIYVKKLPEINNDEEQSILILNSIKNKKEQLWRDYTIFLLNNDIYSEYLKKIDQFVLYQLKFEELFILFKNLNLKEKDIDNDFFHIQNLILGFFLWLVSKNKMLFHSKYIDLNNNKSIQNFCSIVFKNHLVLKKNIELVNNPDTPLKITKSFKRDKILLHQYLLASSTKFNCQLKKLSRNDIDIYTENLNDKKFSGTISQSEYTRIFLKYSGNINALAIPEKETIKEYYLNLVLNSNKINRHTFENYRELIGHIIQLIEFEHYEKANSVSYSRQMIRSLIFLLEYLNEFSKKLSGVELSKMLNTINLNEKGIYNWSIKHDEKVRFSRFTPFYLLFFDNLPEESEYRRIFDKKWLISKKNKSFERSFIRNGFEYPIYVTFQEIALHNPPKTQEYPILRSTPDGEQVDMSWWKHDETNPIIAICNWLISKLPRRSVHILNLDLNTFMQYNLDGTLKGFYINTDKNQSLNANNRFIPAFLVNILFTKEEILILEKYVKYIKEVYGHYVPVEYKNGGNYEPIQPLFPHLDRNDVFPRQLLSAFYTKTLFKTQKKVNDLAKKGFFNNFYSEELCKVKIDYLSKCVLIKSKKEDMLIEDMSDIEEVGYSLNKWYDVFSSIDGMHNMRHAGSSALLSREGLSLMQIKIITGHTSLDTLANVYIKVNEENTKLFIEKIGEEMTKFIEKPTKGGGLYIERNLIPITLSNAPELILKELIDSGFMSLPRYVNDRPVDIYGTIQEQKETIGSDGMVVNGLEIASKFHPDTYECFNHGICTIQRRCPSGTNEVCCLCPHLIFNLLHIEGILYKHQHTLLEMKFIQDKLAKAQQSGDSSVRSELQKLHNTKLNEFIGWNEMIDMISKKFEVSEDFNKNKNDNKANIIRNVENKQRFIFSRTVVEEEMIMELLLKANVLKIDTPETDNLINRISSKIITKALKNQDSETLNKMEKNGLDWIIKIYGEKAFHERKKFLQLFISGINQEENEIKLEQNLIQHKNHQNEN